LLKLKIYEKVPIFGLESQEKITNPILACFTDKWVVCIWANWKSKQKSRIVDSNSLKYTKPKQPKTRKSKPKIKLIFFEQNPEIRNFCLGCRVYCFNYGVFILV
jgi:hypothetical protein